MTKLRDPLVRLPLITTSHPDARILEVTPMPLAWRLLSV